MVSVGEHGVDAHAALEVLLGSPQVAEVVFGYAAEEEVPVVVGVEPRQNVEILYGEGVFPIGKGLPSAQEKHVAVVLGTRDGAQAKQKDYCDKNLFHYFCSAFQRNKDNIYCA